MSTQHYEIIIDSAPRQMRPNAVLSSVFKKLNLNITVPEPTSCCFGQWTFEFKDDDIKSILKSNEENIIDEIKSYYPYIIRYAEWNFD